ncbi:MAG: hypothetical protein ACI4OZ_06075 [Akkermansia sp.]
MISKATLKLLSNPPKWINRATRKNEVILGTMGRLIRNLDGCVFPGWSTEEQRRAVADRVIPALRKLPGCKAATEIAMEDIPYEKRRLMRVHRRLSSVMSARGAGCKVLLCPARDCVFMVNEEEHIALHVFRPGNAPESVLRCMKDTAAKLDKLLPIAQTDTRGYLTSCPDDSGDGTAFSYILHLPALDMAGCIPQIMRATEKLGMGICPYYAVHRGRSEGCGLYTLYSDMSPLDCTELMSAQLAHIATRLEARELRMREHMVKTLPLELEDRIYRAYGTALCTRLLSFAEAVSVLSVIRLGLDVDLLSLPESDKVDPLPLLLIGAEISTPALNDKPYDVPGQFDYFLRSGVLHLFAQNLEVKEFDPATLHE